MSEQNKSDADSPAFRLHFRTPSWQRCGPTPVLGSEIDIEFLRVRAKHTFQRTQIVDEDCGTKMGLVHEIGKQHVGFYQITTQGNTEIIEESDVGKKVTIRTPMFCKTPGAFRFCHFCAGKFFS